jgi:alpha-beta hydrolase superfamily lysophospholipase
MAAQSFSLPTHQHALHALHWPAADAQAVVALIHGHGEHIARYNPMAQVLNQAGIAVVGCDLIGHGESPGKRGHFPNYTEVLNSIEALLEVAHTEYPSAKSFLMGHSMGGNLVANYVLLRKPELAGVVLSAPWLELAFAPSTVDLTLARVMKGIFPGFTQSSKLDAAGISRDPKEVAAYRADAKVHDMVSPGLFMPVVEGGQYVLQHASEWTLPVYLYHGTGDRITSFQASERFAQQAGGDDVTFRAWEGGYHELHHDLEREAVIEALVAWITRHATDAP